jgi:hypothetical protein
MNKKESLFGIIVVIGIMIIALPFVSRFPGGLEMITKDKGILEKEAKPILRAPFADYLWPGIKSERLSTISAGIAGIIIVSLASLCVSLCLRRPKK